MDIPDYENYLTEPRNSKCKAIDSKNLVLEVLGKLNNANSEYLAGDNVGTLEIEGEEAFVLRYKRERDGKTYPVSVLSFDKNNEVMNIKQLQGSRNRQVGFRVNSGFDVTRFFGDLVKNIVEEEGLKAQIARIPSGLEGARRPDRANDNYQRLARCIKEH